jgi:hypothetical protein
VDFISILTIFVPSGFAGDDVVRNHKGQVVSERLQA